MALQLLGSDSLITIGTIGKSASASQKHYFLAWASLAGVPIRQKAKNQGIGNCPDFFAKNNFLLNRILLSLRCYQHLQLFQK
jgi:hypothetical protein